VKAPRASRYQATTLDEKQARALLKAAKGHRLGAMFSVAMAVGLRLGEALGLHWQDVDLAKGTLTVRQALQRIKGKLECVEPKSETSRRAILLTAAAVAVWKRHGVRQKKERLKAGAKWQPSGVVFTSTIGTALDDRNVRRAFRDVLTAANLPASDLRDVVAGSGRPPEGCADHPGPLADQFDDGHVLDAAAVRQSSSGRPDGPRAQSLKNRLAIRLAVSRDQQACVKLQSLIVLRKLVTLNFASWNQLDRWLRQLQALRLSA
jgi:hypothetical protein